MGKYLYNAWYAAGWASELADDAIVGRMILGEHVLMYRAIDGTLVAMGNRCPHRFAPLSMGKRLGDEIACPYHGLRFDRTGSCVFNPHGDGRIPAKVRVSTYPLVEKGLLLWIWMGDAGAADVVQIPELDFMTAPDLHVDIGGSLLMNCHYELVVDNLMDLSHAVFLHQDSLATPDVLRGKLSVAEGRSERELIAETWTPDCTPTGACPPVAGPGKPVDHWLQITWHAPSNLTMRVGATPPGRPRSEGIEVRAAHLITPETETSSHYFFANAIPPAAFKFMPPDMASEKISQKAIFEQEDGVILDAVQRMMGTTDLFALDPVFLAGDGGAVRARRVLQRLILREAECPPEGVSLRSQDSAMAVPAPP